MKRQTEERNGLIERLKRGISELAYIEFFDAILPSSQVTADDVTKIIQGNYQIAKERRQELVENYTVEMGRIIKPLSEGPVWKFYSERK